MQALLDQIDDAVCSMDDDIRVLVNNLEQLSTEDILEMHLDILSKKLSNVPDTFESRDQVIEVILDSCRYAEKMRIFNGHSNGIYNNVSYPYAVAIQTICYFDVYGEMTKQSLLECISFVALLEEPSCSDDLISEWYEDEKNIHLEQFQYALRFASKIRDIYLPTPDREIGLFTGDYLSIEVHQKIIEFLKKNRFTGRGSYLELLPEKDRQAFLAFSRITPQWIAKRSFVPHQEDKSMEQGSHALVRRWIDPETHEHYVVKTYGINSEYNAGLRELLAFHIFSHPNIIRCHSWAVNEDFTALQFFLEDGGEEVNNKYTSVRWIKKYVPQILRALRHIHTRGFAYRDLKMCNLVFQRGRIKLIDLGMMRRTVTFGGSNEMMAFGVGPAEVFEGRTIYPGSVDIWSLGILMCVLYKKNLAIGYGKCKIMPPWNKRSRIRVLCIKDFLEILTKDESEELESFQEKYPGYGNVAFTISEVRHQKLLALIRRCFQKDSPTAGELLRDRFFH